jgi:hypothetical protein
MFGVSTVPNDAGAVAASQGAGAFAPNPSYDPHYNPTEFPDADLVLTAKDDVKFSVHSTVLRLASPIFSDMIALPSSTDNNNTDTTASTVPMSESSNVLKLLLDLIYPGRVLPNISSFTLFYDVTLTAEKYNMQGTLQTLARYLPLLKTWNAQEYAPIPLYALTTRVSWEDAAQMAARETLRSNFANAVSANALGENVGCIDVRTLLSLQDWHASRRSMVLQAVDDLKAQASQSLFEVRLSYPKLDWHHLHTVTGSPSAAYCKKSKNSAYYAFSNSQSPSRSPPTAASKDTYNLALLRFRHRVHYALDERPDGSLLTKDDFWDDALWEFGSETTRCPTCMQTMIQKARLREGLVQLLDQLPRYPGDTRQPTRAPPPQPSRGASSGPAFGAGGAPTAAMGTAAIPFLFGGGALQVAQNAQGAQGT